MTKTVIEKVASSSSEVAVFKVGGTLGYHENKTLQKFFEECKKRHINKLVLDFSDLRSVGGGCARIIQDSAADDGAAVAIVGASTTVRKFLQNQTECDSLIYAASVEEAVGIINFNPEPEEYSSHSGEREESAREQDPEARENRKSHAAARDAASVARDHPVDEVSNVVEEIDELLSQPFQPEPAPKPKSHERQTAGHPGPKADSDTPHVIYLGYEGDFGTAPAAGPAAKSGTGASPDRSAADISRELRNLKKKVVHYNTLLSISSDFSRLEDRASLIDAFLLTTIAQIGVESTAFFEATRDAFIYSASKGIDGNLRNMPSISMLEIDLEEWKTHSDRYEIAQLPFEAAVKNQLSRYDFSYAALFVIQESVRGIFFLGKSIRRSLDSDWFDFFKVLMSQAALSYEKSARLEEESQRTLGLVQTLISLIEENTAGKGTTNLVINYTYSVALRLQYPKEHIKDLMFGAVLRDIGMIKVSDLILRSPRELVQEEWEIIKRHPLDGSEMLSRMKFSQQTRDIVSCHHERFNGEGYPNGLEGHSIPLGARIVSVVESYAAMLQDRPTRPALKEEEALQTLKENWGLRYDPDVVAAFVDIVEQEINSGEKVLYNHNELFKM